MANAKLNSWIGDTLSQNVTVNISLVSATLAFFTFEITVSLIRITEWKNNTILKGYGP